MHEPHNLADVYVVSRELTRTFFRTNNSLHIHGVVPAPSYYVLTATR